MCISIYAIGLLWKIKRPSWGERGFLNILYGLWVNGMMNKEETITAVQTMRNLIMVVTFLSSSMLLLLGLILQSNSIDFSVTTTEVLARFKLMLFVAVIVFSVIMFLLSIRQMVRFSILIGIPVDLIKNIPKNMVSSNKTNDESKDMFYNSTEIFTRDAFLRAMNRFTFGIRAVFYGIVTTLWFVNTYAFIIATISLTVFLIIHHDAEPSHYEELPI